MFTQIKTSKENKEVVSLLTRKLGFGAENVIARVAFTYSLSTNRKGTHVYSRNKSTKDNLYGIDTKHFIVKL